MVTIIILSQFMNTNKYKSIFNYTLYSVQCDKASRQLSKPIRFNICFFHHKNVAISVIFHGLELIMQNYHQYFFRKYFSNWEFLVIFFLSVSYQFIDMLNKYFSVVIVLTSGFIVHTQTSIKNLLSGQY